MISGEKMQVVGSEGQADRNLEMGRRTVDLFNEEKIKAELDRQLEDSERVREAFQGIDGKGDFMFGGLPYADNGEEGFSGDGATLFMLVQFQKEDEPKTELVKIGWGEFSKQTFTKGDKSKYSDYVPEYKEGKYYGYVAQHKVLRSLPFDVYCVSQDESYLSDTTTQSEMCYHPEEYLRKHAGFVVNNGTVTMASKQNDEIPILRGNRNLEYNIVPITEEEALASIGEMTELYRETIKRLKSTS